MILTGTDGTNPVCPCWKCDSLPLFRLARKADPLGMFKRLVSLLRYLNTNVPLGLTLVVDPTLANPARGTRHRLVVGGKVVDVISPSGTKDPSATNTEATKVG
jgi:hypothetical protein